MSKTAPVGNPSARPYQPTAWLDPWSPTSPLQHCQPLQPFLANTQSRPPPPQPQVWLDRATGHVVPDTEDEQRMTRVHGFTRSRVGSREAAAQEDDWGSGVEVGVQGGVQGAAGGAGGGQGAAVVEAARRTACNGDGGEGEDEHANNEEVFVRVFQKLPEA